MGPAICVVIRPIIVITKLIGINANACINNNFRMDVKFLVNNIYPINKLSIYDLL